ncbi:hypothetical protein [Celeribacter naphthalenivorans]|uniref:hypothetical protein n=1 Tax=Celeribacter naphthalenivorans TaxID=1614694 RepID=UPI001CFC38DB|nr:hypothetical protein [Celeribacter naphthalenivorans]
MSIFPKKKTCAALVIAALPATAMAAEQCTVIVQGGGAPWRFSFEEGNGVSCAKYLREEGAQEATCLVETTAEAPATHRYQHIDSKGFWDLREDGLMTGYVDVVIQDPTPGVEMLPFGGICQEVV